MKLSKSQRTRNILIASAEELFGKMGFDETSVAAICRYSGLSNGVFYRHFKNKEEIFWEIVKTIKLTFEDSLNSVAGETLKDSLFSFYSSVFVALWECRKKFMAFHEAEYRFPGVEEDVDGSYTETLKKILKIKEVPFSLKWFCVGSARFLSVYWILFKKSPVPKEDILELVEFILNGLGTDGLISANIIENLPVPVEESKKSTRELIMDSAEAAFGRKGYYKTSIYEIMAGADLGQGTFYIYFESKRNALESLVVRVKENLLSEMKNLYSEKESLITNLIIRYRGFLSYMEKHSNLYRTVRESEFLMEDAAFDYYESIIKFYEDDLKRYLSMGTLRPISPKTVGIFLKGISHSMSLDVVFLKSISDEEFNSQLLEFACYLSGGLNTIINKQFQ